MGVLDDILSHKRSELAGRRARRPLGALESDCRGLPAALDFEGALRPRSGQRVRLIAEVKKASPSQGVIKSDLDPVTQARAYAEAGAAAVSVLTDERYFRGSLDDLVAVRRQVPVPVLRKDFVVDEYQLFEARAWGADAVLLIVAALEQPGMVRLQARARELGLAALVEVHDEGELARAIDAGARIVGVNNRNLRTLEVDVDASYRLAARMPRDVVAVSESGLQSQSDLQRLASVGYRAFLIGERFITDPDPAGAIENLIGIGEPGSGIREGRGVRCS